MSESDPAAGPATARCEVTGAIVPEDELVVFQGQRVCAEGKRILLERLKAGESLTGALERAGVLSRAAAIVIDGFILLVIIYIATILFAIILRGLGPGPIPALLVFMQLIWAAIVFGYYGLVPLIGGQTPGKMFCRIVARNADGSAMRPRTSLLRGLFFLGPNLLGFTASILSEMMTDPSQVVGIVAMMIGCWYLADVLFALIDVSRQRSLHDRIAGTRVFMKE